MIPAKYEVRDQMYILYGDYFDKATAEAVRDELNRENFLAKINIKYSLWVKY